MVGSIDLKEHTENFEINFKFLIPIISSWDFIFYFYFHRIL